MIVLPFHKHQRIDGSMESLGHSFHSVNNRVLQHAPCTVAILVDRGLGGTTQVTASEVSYNVVIPFFGGYDDYEALAYGARMAEHPGIELTVLKFKTPPGISLTFGVVPDNQSTKLSLAEDFGDDEAIFDELENNASVICEEKSVRIKEEIVEVLKEYARCNLFLVGRNPPVVKLSNGNVDCPELGSVGCLLASSGFSTTASVLVIQRYSASSHLQSLVVEEFGTDEPFEIPDTPVNHSRRD